MSARAFDALKASGKLPGLSPAGAALHNMKRAGECDPDEVVRAIESDAALAELCLRLANARRADGQGEFETVDDLVDELGAPSVRCMGLAFAIVLSNRVGVCERFDYDRFWSLSLARGVSAFAVAREVGEPSATAAFACGLLAGIGRLALASVFPSEVAELLSLHGSVDGRELRAHEEGRFELDAHAATLAWLADYGFPDAFVEAVKLSDPVRLDPLGGKPPEGFAGVVATAEQVAGILLEGRASMLAMIGLQRVRRMIDVDRERIALVGDRAAEEWGRWGDLLRIPTHPVPSFAELLSEEILGESRPDVASHRALVAGPGEAAHSRGRRRGGVAAGALAQSRGRGLRGLAGEERARGAVERPAQRPRHRDRRLDDAGDGRHRAVQGPASLRRGSADLLHLAHGRRPGGERHRGVRGRRRRLRVEALPPQAPARADEGGRARDPPPAADRDRQAAPAGTPRREEPRWRDACAPRPSPTCWTELTGNPGLPGGVWGISGIDVSKSDPQNLYAIVENEDGGVFRSRDGGETWSRTNEDRSLRQRAWYYSRIYADPVDAEGVYVVNVRFHHSVDGGKSFSRISVPHGDNHDLWIDPADPERMIQSNDGGANVSFDRGSTWSTQENQPTAQMYRVSVDNAFPYRLLGGQQDNSAVRIRSRSLSGSSITRRDWDPTAGGESGHIVAKPDDPDVVYGGSYGGYLTRLDHRTGERRTVTVWPDNPMGAGAGDLKYRFQWNFPLFFSPHDPDLLYAAANVLFRTRDGGASWERVSPDLTRNDPSKLGSSGGPITQDNTGVEYYCTIFAAFESPHARGVIWCGSDDGRVHVTRDDGATWTDVTPADLPEWTQVNSLEPHPFEPGGAYLAGTRYKLDDFEPYLFRTTDYGATWQRIDGGSGEGGIDRKHFTRVLRADPVRRGLLYAGTELGAYVSFDDGTSWSSLQLDLPISPITDMAVKEGDLIVATQGRGYWILDDLSPLRQLDLEADPGTVTLYEPRPSHRLAMRRSDSPGDAGTNPHPGVLFSYVLTDDFDPEATLQLEILESDGTPIRTFEARTPEGEEADPLPAHLTDDPRQLPTKGGLNRFAWDLRYPGAETFEGAVYWNGGTAGPRAVPGDYRARLTVGDGDAAVVREVAFTLLPDPRTSATPDGFRAQFDFLVQVRDDLTRTHRGIRRLRAATQQIQAAKQRFGDEHSELVEQADTLLDDLQAVEETLYQTKAKSPQDPLNFPIRLGDKLAGLVNVAGNGDFAPTRQVKEVRAFLMEGIEAELAKLDRLLGPRLDAFNASVQEAAIPAVVVEELEGVE